MKGLPKAHLAAGEGVQPITLLTQPMRHNILNPSSIFGNFALCIIGFAHITSFICLMLLMDLLRFCNRECRPLHAVFYSYLYAIIMWYATYVLFVFVAESLFFLLSYISQYAITG